MWANGYVGVMKSDVVKNYRNPMTTKYNGGNAGFRWEEATGGSFGIVVGNDAGTYDAINYWLATTNVGPGLVWPASGWQTFGSNVVLIAAPQTYYHFGQWMGPGTNFIVIGDLNASTVTVIVLSATAMTGTFAENLATNRTPEWWLAQYRWTNDFDAAETNDADGDVMKTWGGYWAGTDPTNAGSVLRMESGEWPWTSNLVVRWWSVSNRSYALDRGTNLMADPPFDFNVRSNISGAPPINAETDTTDTGSGPYFYWIRVE